MTRYNRQAGFLVGTALILVLLLIAYERQWSVPDYDGQDLADTAQLDPVSQNAPSTGGQTKLSSPAQGRTAVSSDDRSAIRVYNTSLERVDAECVNASPGVDKIVMRSWTRLASPPAPRDMIAIRAPGYVGSRALYSIATREGIVLKPAGTVTITLQGYAQRLRRKPARVFLFPDFSDIPDSPTGKNWEARWPLFCADRQARVDAGGWEIASFWGVGGTGLDQWENALQPSVLELDEAGKATFRNVVPHSAYRVGFIPSLGLLDVEPAIDMATWGRTVMVGNKKALRVRGGPKLQHTIAFPVESGLDRPVGARYALGRIIGAVPSDAHFIRLKLFRKVEAGFDFDMVQMSEVTNGSAARGQFLYSNLTPGWMYLQIACRQSSNYWIYSDTFLFAGGEYNLGSLTLKGQKRLTLRWGGKTSMEQPPDGRDLQVDILFRTKNKRFGGHNRLRTKVRWGEIMNVFGISHDRCSITVVDVSNRKPAHKFKRQKRVSLGAATDVYIEPEIAPKRFPVSIGLRGLSPQRAKNPQSSPTTVFLYFMKNRKLIHNARISMSDALAGKRLDLELPEPPVKVIAHCHKNGLSASGKVSEIELSGTTTWNGESRLDVDMMPSYLARFRLLDTKRRPEANSVFHVLLQGSVAGSIFFGRTDAQGYGALNCLPMGTKWSIFGYVGVIERRNSIIELKRKPR